MATLSTHVLDTATGRPAAGMLVELARADAPDELVGAGVTDTDGRIGSLADAAGGVLAPGVWVLRFHAGAYFTADGRRGFHPRIDVLFEATDETHLHVPLLVSPFGYTTYRGS